MVCPVFGLCRICRSHGYGAWRAYSTSEWATPPGQKTLRNSLETRRSYRNSQCTGMTTSLPTGRTCSKRRLALHRGDICRVARAGPRTAIATT